jgi:hypothetical protein
VQARAAYRGPEERDYLKEMYSENEVFVTGDGDFVRDLSDLAFGPCLSHHRCRR